MPLNIYRCPLGHIQQHAAAHPLTHEPNGPQGYSCAHPDCILTTQPVRVFTEDETRPLWEALDHLLGLGPDDTAARHWHSSASHALDAFPATWLTTENETR